MRPRLPADMLLFSAAVFKCRMGVARAAAHVGWCIQRPFTTGGGTCPAGGTGREGAGGGLPAFGKGRFRLNTPAGWMTGHCFARATSTSNQKIGLS